MKRVLIIVLVVLSFKTHAQLKEGVWRGELIIHDSLSLPFNFDVKGSVLTVRNGEERIDAPYEKQGDSVYIHMPVFNTVISAAIFPGLDKVIVGQFVNTTRKVPYPITFRAEAGASYRFTDRPEKPAGNITGRWRAKFEEEDPGNEIAVGVFNQEGARVTGTFLTTSGDYRFLEGELAGTHLSLSAFDGSHAFLFTAEYVNGKLQSGHFFSGNHGHEMWSAERDENVKLADERSFTSLKPGYSKVDFSFPDESGKMISLSDPQFKDKAIIIQIMGTWCPNCMDETKYLSNWFNTEAPADVAIIGLNYERRMDTTYVNVAIRRLKDRYAIKYPILFAGNSDREAAAKTLPMIDRIAGFPTTIYIDKKGNVREIHTGFNGPATGKLFEEYKVNFKALIEELRK